MATRKQPSQGQDKTGRRRGKAAGPGEIAGLNAAPAENAAGEPRKPKARSRRQGQTGQPRQSRAKAQAVKATGPAAADTAAAAVTVPCQPAPQAGQPPAPSTPPVTEVPRGASAAASPAQEQPVPDLPADEPSGQNQPLAASPAPPSPITRNTPMTTTSIPAPGASAIRKPTMIKPRNAILLGLLALTVISGFRASRTTHLAAGLLLTAGLGAHCWKRRKAL